MNTDLKRRYQDLTSQIADLYRRYEELRGQYNDLRTKRDLIAYGVERTLEAREEVAAEGVTRATPKPDRIVAVDRILAQFKLRPDDLVRHWIAEREQQVPEVERPAPDATGRRSKRDRLLADFHEAQVWMAAFGHKFGIPKDRWIECFLDMAAFFDLLGHSRAKELAAEQEAKNRARYEALLEYGHCNTAQPGVATD